MKYSVALLFALVVVGSTGAVAECGQCPNNPNPIQSIGIGTITRSFISRVVDAIVQFALKIINLFIPAIPVPVEAILMELALTSHPNVRAITDITLNLLDLVPLCFVLNLVPLQLLNIPLNIPDLIEFLTPQLEALPPGCPVDFSLWSEWVGEFLVKSVTSNLVNLFNSIPSL